MTARPTGRRPLICTYRVQLHAGFGFDDAAAIVPYLADLGVSHLYCSPYLQAAPGSTHGYDVVDHDVVNRELGGAAGHARMIAALEQYGLGQVVDVVPNHMSVATAENRWWWDVLENGPASRYADHFDVDWDPPEAKLRNQVLVPVLGDQYGRVLDAGDIRVVRHGAEFVVEYFEHRFPIAPPTLDGLLSTAADHAGDDTLAYLADAHHDLPHATTKNPERLARRQRDKQILADLLARRLGESPESSAAIDGAIDTVNGDRVALHQLLERQNYRLAFWRTGSQELDYRRFFDVTTLAGLRVERTEVFEAVHASILDWYRRGQVDGLRIDHPDGLRDPAGYLQTLRERAPEAWLLVEKILEPGESMPEDWPVDGTTGYDFMQQVDGLFVDPLGEAALTETLQAFTGSDESYDEVVRRSKRDTLRLVLAADVARSTEQFHRVCESQLRYRDFTRADLRRTLTAVLVSFGVYRTYVRVDTDGRRFVDDTDRRTVRAAADAALALDPSLDAELLDFLVRVLLLDVADDDAVELALRFQQLSGPAMAKGVEDTTFYRYLRLVSLNEVGGDPGRFGIELDDFHRANADAAVTRPRRMLASSTHDTKRSEDVRARISLLAECPDEWAETVARWSAMNDRHRRGDLPDRATEYLLYQTLVGTHPISRDRIAEYLEKAVREAKEHTSWLEPDGAYESAVLGFVDGVVADESFMNDLDRFVAGVTEPARESSLGRLVLKLTCPGVPDVYQGTELWTGELVDPDNRRPVDHGRRAALLPRLDRAVPDLSTDDDGIAKLFVLHRLLGLRRRRPDSFAGSYERLPVEGRSESHAIAFTRADDVAVCVPRFTLRLRRRGGLADTSMILPAGTWTNVFTGESVDGRVPLAQALGSFPVGVWERSA